MNKKITIKVPATSANCGPGFDSLGFACNLYNYFTFELIDEGLVLEVFGEGENTLNASTENLAFLSFFTIWDKIRKNKTGLKITMENNIPLSRGLGSSSTAIVAGLMAANGLTGDNFSKDEILTMATNIEGHPDNVAPTIFGNFTISYLDEMTKIPKSIVITPKNKIKFVAIVPNTPLSTKKAREVLPKDISHEDAVFNVSRVSVLIASLLSGDYSNLSVGLEDKLHQPYRLPLINCSSLVIERSKELGAYNTTISGAGSTLMVYLPIELDAKKVAENIVSYLKENNYDAKYFILELDSQGATVLNQ